MIKTRRQYRLCGADYSAQEVRVFAANCKDEKMIKTYEEGKDLYSEVASMVYGVPYDECKEFRPDGSFNLAGKQRRTAAKSIILGLMYGRGVRSIADQIKRHDGPVSREDMEEAKRLSDSFFNNYPGAKKWIDDTHEKAKRLEYVEDLWGRRRRLPDINLPKYTFESIEEDASKFNPLIGSTAIKKEVNSNLVSMYSEKLDRARSKEARDVIINEARKNDKIKILSNTGFIAQAERQSVNAIIQGGSATITKLAIRNMCNNKEMKELDFHLLVPVHDEVIGEAPLWNIERCRQLMSEEMSNSAKPECVVPMKTDGDIFTRWYSDVAYAHLKEDYEKLLEKGISQEEALKEIYEDNCEFEEQEIREALSLQ